MSKTILLTSNRYSRSYFPILRPSFLHSTVYISPIGVGLSPPIRFPCLLRCFLLRRVCEGMRADLGDQIACWRRLGHQATLKGREPR